MRSGLRASVLVCLCVCVSVSVFSCVCVCVSIHGLKKKKKITRGEERKRNSYFKPNLYQIHTTFKIHTASIPGNSLLVIRYERGWKTV